MATLGQLYKGSDTGITVKKTYMVPFDALYIDEENNIREVDQDHAATFREMWLAGDIPDPLLVEIMPDQRIRIVDGQHRFVGACMARDLGLEIARIECKDFNGTEADRYSMMFKRAQGKKLLPLQVAKACQKMEAFGLSRKEIAEKLGVSASYVAAHIDLNDCSDALKELVGDGKLSYANAVEMQREHGAGADEEAARLLEVAQEQGKSKITKKVKDGDAAKRPKKLFGAKQGLRLAELLACSMKLPDDEGHFSNHDFTFDFSLESKVEIYNLIESYLEDGEND